MTQVARYIIVLDRYDDDDYAAQGLGYGHDGTAKAACEQVAAELQEAMTAYGPAGFFNVIERRLIPDNERVTQTTADEQARALGITRMMEDDPNPSEPGAPGNDEPDEQA